MLTLKGLIFVLLTLIFLILAIIIIHNLRAEKRDKEFEQKRESWEPDFFEFLYGQKSYREIEDIFEKDYENLTTFLLPFLKNIRGEDHQRIKKLSQKIGMVDYYISKLKTGRKNEKIKAANFLGKVKAEQALIPLVKLLNSKNKELMTAGAWAIAEIGEERYFVLVLKVIINETYMTFEGITELFIQFGENICQQITDLLSEWLKGSELLKKIFITDEYNVVALFIDLLGSFRYEKGVCQLKEILNRTVNTEVLIHVFKALVKIEKPIKIDLFPYLTHDNWVVKSQAVRYAGIIKADKYTEIMVNLLQKADNWWVKYYAGQALIRIGKIDLLEKIVNTNQPGSQMGRYLLGQKQN